MLPRHSDAQLPDTLSTEATVSIVTVLPGTYVYTVFGHIAVRVEDPAQNLDIVFNYGTFEYSASFVPKFVNGKLDYRLSIGYTVDQYKQYRAENRTIIEQSFDLGPSETSDIYAFLRNNARPENRYYRYDFFYDNCSTRIRDLLETVLGSSLVISASEEKRESFRELLEPYLSGRSLLRFGINLGLGADVDKVATKAERTFLPVELMLQLGSATVSGNSLVSRVDTVFVAENPDRSSLPFVAILGWSLLAISVVSSFAAKSLKSSSKVASRETEGLGANRSTDSVELSITERQPKHWLDVLLFGLAGVAGLVLIYLWFATEHVVTDNNMNLVWALPLNLVAAVMIARRRESVWLGRYLAGFSALLLVLLVGWRFWPQELPAAVLPVVVLLMLRSGQLYLSSRAQHE